MKKFLQKFSEIIYYTPSFQSAQVKEEVFLLPSALASLKGRTLLFISDVHLSDIFTIDALRLLLRQMASFQPDMILLGGDYAESREWQEQFFAELSTLKPPLGIYAVVGNNDSECFPKAIHEMEQLAARCGVTLLVNRSIRIKADEADITIAGLDDFEYGRCTKHPLFDQQDAFSLRILLSHYPQGAAYYAANFGDPQPHLSLSGHTHGGQFSICGITPFSVGFERRIHGMKLPAISGWTNLGSTRLLVSPGIGTSRLPFRLNVPPAFHLIRL